MTRNGKILDNKTYPIEEHSAFIDAITNVMECFAKLESAMWKACYDEAYEEGRQAVFEEMNQLSGKFVPRLPEEDTVKPKAGLSELEKVIDQTIYSDVSNNPGSYRTTDLITKTIQLTFFKPSLTEKDVKLSIKRLERDKKMENRSGRWHSTQPKTGGQQYQVMAYLPDGSKYLGTDVIKEQ